VTKLLRGRRTVQGRGVVSAQERLKLSAASHGLDLEGYETNFQPVSRQPNVDAGEAATPETIQARDRRDSGEGGEDLTPYRKKGFQKFFANRGQGVDCRPCAVRVDRVADDRLYPDRQTGTG